MKLTVRTQLSPDAETEPKRKALVEAFNQAANRVAGECFERKTADIYGARPFAYREVHERFGLSSQMAQHAIKVACDAYRRDKSICPSFLEHVAVVYDRHTMNFKGVDRVSLLVLGGRVVVPFVMGKYQAEQLARSKGEATTSDGEWHSGKDVEDVRRKDNLQRKGTTGAKKKLRRASKTEARFHRISAAVEFGDKRPERRKRGLHRLGAPEYPGGASVEERPTRGRDPSATQGPRPEGAVGCLPTAYWD